MNRVLVRTSDQTKRFMTDSFSDSAGTDYRPGDESRLNSSSCFYWIYERRLNSSWIARPDPPEAQNGGRVKGPAKTPNYVLADNATIGAQNATIGE